MIVGQALTLRILPAGAAEDAKGIGVTAKSDGTTILLLSGETVVLRTATLIALGRKLQAVWPNAINETVE